MQRISYFLFIFLLLFSPLAFGTVETWSMTILETITAVSFLLLGISYVQNETPGLKIPGLIPLLLLLGFMAFQLVPLPMSLVKILSPATFDLYSPLLGLAPDKNFIPLTVDRRGTILTLLTFTAYGLFYILTIYHCREAKQLKQTAMIVASLGIFIAVEAILQKLTSPEEIYWFRPTPSGSPTGPWVYRNHFAGFMEMLFPLAVALFLCHRPLIKYSKTLREKFISVMTIPGANRHLLLGTGSVLMAVSILLSLSRGGIITLSLAFIFFVYFSARTTSNNRTTWAIILFILVILMISWLGWDPIFERFSRIWGIEGLDTSGRLPVLIDSVELFKIFPVFGTGFGTFIHVYPFVRTVPGESIFDHAHNDYIELLSTGGLIGFLLVTWFLVSILTNVIKMLMERKDRYAILMTSGAVTGILALLFHCAVDFQMYNGANGLYLFFLCGLAVSFSNTRFQYRTSSTFLKERDLKATVYLSSFALLFLVACIWIKWNGYRAEQTVLPFQTLVINKSVPPEKLVQLREAYTKSARLDPLRPYFPFMLGKISTLEDEKEMARNEYLHASLMLPTSGEYLQHLALSLDDDNGETKTELLKQGISRNPQSVASYLNYSQWLLFLENRQESFKVLNQALEKIPWKTGEIVDFMLPFRFSEKEIRQMLSDIPAAWYEVGRRMEKNKQYTEAIYYYHTAIEIAGEEEASATYFQRLYSVYTRQKEEKKSLETLKLAIRYLPDHARFRIMMGDYYLRNDIPYRARQEYIQALRLDPDNISIKRKLNKLEED